MSTIPLPASMAPWLLLAVPVMVSGCLSAPRTLPRDLVDMRSVYEDHMAGDSGPDHPHVGLRAARRAADRPRSSGASALGGYTRSAWNEIELLFAPLPNPAIVLYIDPHLAEAGHPVPGYSTAFTLYETPQWALPGELPPPSRAGASAQPVR